MYASSTVNARTRHMARASSVAGSPRPIARATLGGSGMPPRHSRIVRASPRSSVSASSARVGSKRSSGWRPAARRAGGPGRRPGAVTRGVTGWHHAPLRGVRSIPLLVALVSCASYALYAVAASAGSPVPAGSSVAVFSIAKSENKNQVQYVIRVDDHCAPVGPAPVSAYWRMLEKGPAETAPILAREVRAYGLASQAVVGKDASGGQTRVVLTAL